MCTGSWTGFPAGISTSDKTSALVTHHPGNAESNRLIRSGFAPPLAAILSRRHEVVLTNWLVLRVIASIGPEPGLST